MQKLRFLHVSDLHVAGKYSALYKTTKFIGVKTLSVYNRNALAAIAEVAYKWQDSLDAILISGDIVVSAVDSDQRHAIELFKTPAHSFPEQPWLNSKREPTLSFFNKPIIVVPGNHDRYITLTSWPSKNFDNHFSFCWDAGFGGIKNILLPNAQAPMLAVICADFALEKSSDSISFRGRWGQGRVYKERLNKLKKITNDLITAYPQCAILWMMHFAPNFEEFKVDFDTDLMLIDSHELVQAATAMGIERIFCGHTHMSGFYRTSREKKVAIHCAGTSGCIDEHDGAKIHLRDISINNGKIVQIDSLNLTYDSSRLMFL